MYELNVRRPTPDIMLNCEILKAFSLPAFLVSIVLEVLIWAVGKKNKCIRTAKGKKQTIIICRQHDYIKGNPKIIP